MNIQPAPATSLAARNSSVGTRTLCQPSLVRSHHVYADSRFRRLPLILDMLLAFSICTLKLYFVRLVKEFFQVTRLGEIGSAGIFIFQS